jgi:hypothetical protein
MNEENDDWPEVDDDYPDIAGGFAKACEPDIDRLLTPYFEAQGRTGAEVFELGEPAPADKAAARAHADAEKRDAVVAIAADLGALYEHLGSLGVDLAELCDAVAKVARARPKPTMGRPRGLQRKFGDDELLDEYDQGHTAYAIAKRRAAGDPIEHDKIRKRVATLVADRKRRDY